MDSDDGDSDDYLGSLEVDNVSDKDHVIWVSPEVQGRVVKMELDTGSAVSVLPYKQYKEHFGHVKLEKSLVTVKTYTGQKITHKGEMKCNVKFKGQEKELTLQVVETSRPALFVRDFLSKMQLNWGEIKVLKLSKTPGRVLQRKVDQLLQQYESVFSEGVGILKGHKADLTVFEGCQPISHKPRQVPYALHPKVEVELARLERDGILSKVEYSEWAIPIVPVVKRNGSTRVCGDFKISVSPVLLAEQYPLPRTRETRRDPVLARVHESIVKGWSARIDGDKPFYERRNELTVHQGCILWGMRVVIPNKLQERVFEELHDGHGHGCGKDESRSEELRLVA